MCEKEPRTVISSITLSNDFGEETILAKEHTTEDIIHQLYLMEVGKTLHVTFVGTDAFNRHHYSFTWDAEERSIENTVKELINAGWTVTKKGL